MHLIWFTDFTTEAEDQRLQQAEDDSDIELDVILQSVAEKAYAAGYLKGQLDERKEYASRT